MDKSKEYLNVSLPNRIVVPQELIGKLTDILAQCGSQEYVWRTSGANAIHFARPMEFSINTGNIIDLSAYDLPQDKFRQYCDALKDTTGDDVMGAEEWLKLQGN